MPKVPAVPASHLQGEKEVSESANNRHTFQRKQGTDYGGGILVAETDIHSGHLVSLIKMLWCMRKPILVGNEHGERHTVLSMNI